MNTEQTYLPANASEHVDPELHEDDAREHARVLERYGVMQTFWTPIHAEGRRDDAFLAGEQWDAKIREEREETGRPCLTYNLLPAFTRQIINKVRQDRPQLRVKPVESDRHQTPDVTNVQGTKDYSLADVFMGLWRNVEHTSRATQAYDHALKGAVEHGFGFFSLGTRYSRHDPFVQELVVERIKDPYSVFIDPTAQAADYSDAQDAIVLGTMTRAAFRAMYKDATEVEAFNGSAMLDGWWDSDTLTIATYYWIDWRDDEVVRMTNGKIHYVSDVEDVLEEMKRNSGVMVARVDGEEMRRKVKRPMVCWRKLNAIEFLTPVTETPFEMIPIFPVLGDEFVVDNQTRYHSAIRDARDPQRSYNYWRTAAAEAVALAPKAPFVASAQQTKGHEHVWEKANTENVPYLPYNETPHGKPPTRVAPGNPAAAELANATQDVNDIQAIIGLHEASLGAESNEKSGKAIRARQSQGATSTYTFPANLARSIEAMGRVAVQAMPRIYNSERVVRVRLPDDTEDFVELNKVEKDEETGNTVLVHDLAYGKYDVVIDTGPSYQTQREESIERMIDLLQVIPPEVASVVVHLIVKQMGFPGADEIAMVLRKSLPDHLKSEEDRAADLPKGVVFNEQGEPVDEASGEPWQPPLSPAEQLQQETNQIEREKLEAQKLKAEGEKAKAQATIAKAKADETKAQAELAAAGAPAPDTATPGDLEAMRGDVEAIIADAFRTHEQSPTAHADAIRASAIEAAVQALAKVRGYIDKRLGSNPTA